MKFFSNKVICVDSEASEFNLKEYSYNEEGVLQTQSSKIQLLDKVHKDLTNKHSIMLISPTKTQDMLISVFDYLPDKTSKNPDPQRKVELAIYQFTDSSYRKLIRRYKFKDIDEIIQNQCSSVDELIDIMQCRQYLVVICQNSENAHVLVYEFINEFQIRLSKFSKLDNTKLSFIKGLSKLHLIKRLDREYYNSYMSKSSFNLDDGTNYKEYLAIVVDQVYDNTDEISMNYGKKRILIINPDYPSLNMLRISKRRDFHIENIGTYFKMSDKIKEQLLIVTGYLFKTKESNKDISEGEKDAKTTKKEEKK